MAGIKLLLFLSVSSISVNANTVGEGTQEIPNAPILYYGNSNVRYQSGMGYQIPSTRPTTEAVHLHPVYHQPELNVTSVPQLEYCPKKNGIFPTSDGHHNKYLLCQEGHATVVNCSPGLAFNPLNFGCDWPENIPSNVTQAPAPAPFPTLPRAPLPSQISTPAPTAVSTPVPTTTPVPVHSVVPYPVEAPNLTQSRASLSAPIPAPAPTPAATLDLASGPPPVSTLDLALDPIPTLDLVPAPVVVRSLSQTPLLAQIPVSTPAPVRPLDPVPTPAPLDYAPHPGRIPVPTPPPARALAPAPTPAPAPTLSHTPLQAQIPIPTPAPADGMIPAPAPAPTLSHASLPARIPISTPAPSHALISAPAPEPALPPAPFLKPAPLSAQIPASASAPARALVPTPAPTPTTPYFPYSAPAPASVPTPTTNPNYKEICPKSFGFFPMTDGECSTYMSCQEGKATIMNCPPGLVFNPDMDTCDWPENVPLCNPHVFKDFTCPEPPMETDGSPSSIIYKYRYGKHCRTYIACHWGYPRLLRCDTGTAFDEISHACIDTEYVMGCETNKYT